MPIYRNRTTGLRVRRDDDSLDGVARWERLPDPDPEPEPVSPAVPEPASEPELELRPVPGAEDDVFTLESGEPDAEPASDPGPVLRARPTGRGWYQVDGMDRKVRGRDLPAGVVIEGG